jgi:hypothetical protein
MSGAWPGLGRTDQVAETLRSGIPASGLSEIEFELTPHGAALGLAEVLPPGGLDLRVSGHGRGERSSAATTDLPITMRLAEPPEPCDWLWSA